VTLQRIEVHRAGEDKSEWRMKIEGNATAGKTGGYEKTWESDGVMNESSRDLNTEWLFDLKPNERIRIKTSGLELDGGIFDPDDVLPGVEVDVDPRTAGNQYSVSGR
jgi:hypothetical protein